MSAITLLRSGQSAALDPTGSGFAHGFGLFETIKLSDRRLCYWAAHWERLRRSAEVFGLPLEVGIDDVLGAIRELVTREKLTDATIKLSLLKEKCGARLYVYSRPAFPVPESISLRLGLACPLNEHSPLAGHKTHNYMENMYLLERCRADGFFDQIRLNTAGHLAETTTANLFLIRNGRVHTPAVETGILPGVVRRFLVDAAGVEVGRFSAQALGDAEAVCLSNSSVGVLPVGSIAFPDGRVRQLDRAHPEGLELVRRHASQEQAHSVLC